MYSISEAAKLLEISSHTLRYYEKEQIILPDRNDHGEREYGDSHIAWLRFVIKLKQTQMPLVKIREYSRLYQEGEHTQEARLRLLEEHRNSVREQISTLQETEKMLDHKIGSYKEMINPSI
ncbi:MerR family transcriptional regulator [Fictibacillus sp. KIGAM418]|uniref:MerR family transcriptional regulator n=1 Tax=Fictibacillus marinisediminis TaxID=2878389 RepID=A0A9X2BCB9_9BACL|nr:MerR family transcriptional regulator [Fictibacillus marinisediminis]MCK6256286.1 MerR family transcriptional regulator [Fictibacillus marinisediminis]